MAVHIMLIREPVIAKPAKDPLSSGYDLECREALRPHLEAVLELAIRAGWDRNVAGYSLMYLSAKAVRASEGSSGRQAAA